MVGEHCAARGPPLSDAPFGVRVERQRRQQLQHQLAALRDEVQQLRTRADLRRRQQDEQQQEWSDRQRRTAALSSQLPATSAAPLRLSDPAAPPEPAVQAVAAAEVLKAVAVVDILRKDRARLQRELSELERVRVEEDEGHRRREAELEGRRAAAADSCRAVRGSLSEALEKAMRHRVRAEDLRDQVLQSREDFDRDLLAHAKSLFLLAG
eukprot:TRINITY_DN16317_c0_g1_i2.p1 TRINITY_DN16317_c0_g1~~TRINITY_DN16317_c0_g1_i2.p1  ORF type:complete len:226 (+),score=107.19 TRINITY_DN16317_c0_g1_i2:50-679(+)